MSESNNNNNKIQPLSFGKHSKFERQSVNFIICFFVLIVSAAMCYYHDYNVKKERALTINASGTKVSFSLNHTDLTLEKIHWSSDKREAYIPFTLDSLKGLSTNPNDYKIFVRAAYGAMSYKPTGHLILFGSTGRGAIMIKSAKTIPNEVLTIYIENLAKFHDATTINQQADLSAVKGDKGFEDYFSKHDMLLFTVSPGARDIAKQKRITASLDNPVKLYTQLFGNYDVARVEKQIKHDQKEIKLYQETANKLKANLENSGYTIPVKPKWLADDWKPIDYVNPKTGRYQNGHKFSEDDNIEDPDQLIYPSSLVNKDGTSTDNTDTNEANVVSGSSSITVSDGASQASQWWTSLQTAWDTIRDAKRDWMVNQNINLYKLKYIKLQQARSAKVSKASAFNVIGKVDVK